MNDAVSLQKELRPARGPGEGWRSMTLKTLAEKAASNTANTQVRKLA